MARLKYDRIAAVSNFLDTLDLTPRVLITKEVVELISRSWDRELQRKDLSQQKKDHMKQLILNLSRRKRKQPPILSNMQPLNFEPLYDDVHTTYCEEDSLF